MATVKFYVVEGKAKIGDFWNVFRMYVRAVKPADAVEHVYSRLGSTYNIKRSHIRIIDVKEVEQAHVKDENLIEYSKIDRIIVYR